MSNYYLHIHIYTHTLDIIIYIGGYVEYVALEAYCPNGERGGGGGGKRVVAV
jgi:hypothetical protein